jgi:glycosyltransferase involved in cell wall biosynthesis
MAINSSFLFSSQFHRLIDHHLPISHFVAEANKLTDHLPPNVIHIVPAPVPDAIFECKLGDKPPSGIPEDVDYILFVGALTRAKGLEILLDAYQGLENKAKLVLIGTDWPDSPEHYPEGVIVIKNAPHDEVMKAFRHCLFSVVPSLWAEPFGQVAVEAMAASKPVIASAHGGLTDIVTHQETGILVNPGDPIILHEAMIELLDDADLRTQLGLQGHLRAKQRFTCTQVTNQIEKICKDVLTGVSIYK